MSFYIGFYRFSTEELRLATGASAPVARNKKGKVCSTFSSLTVQTPFFVFLVVSKVPSCIGSSGRVVGRPPAISCPSPSSWCRVMAKTKIYKENILIAIKFIFFFNPML